MPYVGLCWLSVLNMVLYIRQSQSPNLSLPTNRPKKQHAKKQRHYFANKGPSSQGCGFSSSHVWVWELDPKENWLPQNWCFELWCWRRLLRVSWTARRSNQSILKEISPGCSLEGLMLKLKLQSLVTWYEKSARWKRPWCWERLKARGEGMT